MSSCVWNLVELLLPSLCRVDIEHCVPHQFVCRCVARVVVLFRMDLLWIRCLLDECVVCVVAKFDLTLRFVLLCARFVVCSF